MADEENVKPEEMQESVEESGKDLGDKANEALDTISEGAKKAGQKAGEALEDITEGAKKAGAKAGEMLGDLAEGTKKMTEKAGETASEVVGSILTGMKKVGDKATDAVEVLDLKRQISQLESANKKVMPKIGKAVLDLYAANKIDDPGLMDLCKEIEMNNQKADELKAQIEELKENEKE